MDSEDFLPMPVQGTLQQDESLMGFVLRMANANKVQGIHWLYQRLNREKLNRFKFEDCAAIAIIFGAPLEEIQRAMWVRKFSYGVPTNILDSIKVTRPYLIRPLRPQICIHCLLEHRYCRLSWDLQFVCMCPIHLCPLIDRCPNCLRHIQWMRPFLELCNCGLSWGEIQVSQKSLDSPGIRLATLFQHKLRPSSITFTPSNEFEVALEGLSIDAISKLIWIFGFKETPETHVGPGQSQKILRTDNALACAERGYSRLKDICCAATHDEFSPALDSIHIGGLKGFVWEVDSMTDMRFADWLAREIARQSKGQYAVSARTQRQLHLF